MSTDGWSDATLGAAALGDQGLVDGPFGSNLPASEYVSEGVPVIRGSNLSLGTHRFLDDGFVYVAEETAKRLSRSLCYPGDIVFTKKGTLGQTGFIPHTARYSRYLLSSNQMRLRVDPRSSDALFVYYFVSAASSRHRIIQDASVTGVPKINVAYLRRFPIRLPPLLTQRKIAAVLSGYDELIENNTRRINLLEEMAQRVYREWFVDFRYPRNGRVAIVDSVLGPIPQGWQVRRLGDVVELAYGKALKADDRRGGRVAVYGSGGQVGWHDVALVDGPGIVVGRKGNVGSVYWSDGPFFPIDTTYYVKTDLPLAYVYFGLCDLAFIDSHAAVPGLSRNQAYGLRFLVPDAETCRLFNEVVSPAFTLRRTLIDATENLRTTRDLVLPRLISGEIGVEHLDVAVADAAA